MVEGGYDLNAIIREPAPPVVTGGFDLEVQAFNGGPSVAPSAKLEVSSSADDPSACSQLPSGTVQLGDIPADDGSNELFGVTCEQPTTISVTASASGVPADQEREPSDNFDTMQIVVEGGYDLNAIIREPAPPVVTGGFDLEVQAFNGGPSLAPSAKLEVSSSADDPSACSQLPSGTVQLGDIPADDGSNELFGVTCEQPTTISVTASASGVPADQEREPSDNFDTMQIVVEGAGPLAIPFRFSFALENMVGDISNQTLESFRTEELTGPFEYNRDLDGFRNRESRAERPTLTPSASTRSSSTAPGFPIRL